MSETPDTHGLPAGPTHHRHVFLQSKGLPVLQGFFSRQILGDGLCERCRIPVGGSRASLTGAINAQDTDGSLPVQALQAPTSQYCPVRASCCCHPSGLQKKDQINLISYGGKEEFPWFSSCQAQQPCFSWEMCSAKARDQCLDRAFQGLLQDQNIQEKPYLLIFSWHALWTSRKSSLRGGAASPGNKCRFQQGQQFLLGSAI